MDTYSLMREFADSWMLLFLFAFFTACVIWVFRPGSSETYGDTADIPFRNEDKPACDQGCATCSCDAQLKEAWK